MLCSSARLVGVHPRFSGALVSIYIVDIHQRLLGKSRYASLLKSGFSHHDFCREIAQDAFIHELMDSPTQSDDIALIQNVAHRLWKGDGVTGLHD